MRIKQVKKIIIHFQGGGTISLTRDQINGFSCGFIYEALDIDCPNNKLAADDIKLSIKKKADTFINNAYLQGSVFSILKKTVVTKFVIESIEDVYEIEPFSDLVDSDDAISSDGLSLGQKKGYSEYWNLAQTCGIGEDFVLIISSDIADEARGEFYD